MCAAVASRAGRCWLSPFSTRRTALHPWNGSMVPSVLSVVSATSVGTLVKRRALSEMLDELGSSTTFSSLRLFGSQPLALMSASWYTSTRAS